MSRVLPLQQQDSGRRPAAGGDAQAAQAAERITAEEVAKRLGTINYEVTCALTPRVPRLYRRDGEPLDGDPIETGGTMGIERPAQDVGLA